MKHTLRQVENVYMRNLAEYSIKSIQFDVKVSSAEHSFNNSYYWTVTVQGLDRLVKARIGPIFTTMKEAVEYLERQEYI